MSIKERYAHTQGRGCVKYFPDGSKVLTGGPDGDIRVYGGIKDDELMDLEPITAGDEILGAVADDQGRIYVAPKIPPGDKFCNDVVTFVLKDGEATRDKVITKFAAEPTCVDVSKDGTLVLAGSADMTVRLVNSETFATIRFNGHNAPILNVALSPQGDFALSSSCDGSVKLWKIESEKCIKTIPNCWPEANDVCRSKSSGLISWHPKGNKFAVPLLASVKIFAKENEWDECSLKSTSAEDFFTSTDFSPCGNFLAAGTAKGKLVFWNIANEEVFYETKCDKDTEICGLHWNPKVKDEIAFMREDGYWGVINDFLKPSSKPTINEKETQEKMIDEDNMDPDELAAALFDDDDDDNENSFSIRRIKKETGFLDPNEDTTPSEKGNFDDDSASVKSVVTDVVTAKPPPAPAPALELDIQESFQPGSTPSHLESRYMVWNSVGIVQSFNSDEESSINVEFHDSAIHHPIHLGNNNGYSMADLSAEAVLLASEADEAEGSSVPSKLMCHHFAASGVSKEWSIDMPAEEDILAICCGLGWVAAATDRRNLRIFSVGGMQREIISLPGPVVALSGFGSKIMITIHIGMPLPGNQSIGVCVLNIGSNSSAEMASFAPLPLAPKSFLAWQGFTDEGTPCIMDSAGYIRILSSLCGNSWTQICDSKSITKGKSDNYFMVGANLQEFTARCILVKGSRYPATVPKPVISVLPLKLPLCGEENEKSEIEQSYWKAKIISRAIENPVDFVPAMTPDEIEQMENEALIKLFAHACQMDHDARAIDICKLMSSVGLQLAIKYATKCRRMQLAGKISQMACEKQDAEEELERHRELERETTQSQASEDIFASQDEDIDMDAPQNPFLAAQAKKAISGALKSNLTPTGGARNPFKKATTPSSASSQIRSGIVFDEIARKDVMKNPAKNKTSFGDRKIETSQKTTPSRKVVLAKKSDKENKSSFNQIPETPPEGDQMKKGFLLWFEENSQAISQEENVLDHDKLHSHCLNIWQGMSKVEKESYKTPRVPKRKREESNPSSTSAKLAKYAA